LRIVYAPKARADLQTCIEYIAKDNPSADVVAALGVQTALAQEVIEQRLDVMRAQLATVEVPDAGHDVLA
jgi:plasmid stabilization system protein ParE